MQNELRFVRVCQLRAMVIRLWQPTPLTPPAVNRSLPQMTAVQRYSEVMRYSALRLEFWLSPNGRLREWARFNVGLALLIGIPSILVMPIITFLFGQFTSWTNYLVNIAQNFLLFPILMLAAAAVVTALLCFVRGLLGK